MDDDRCRLTSVIRLLGPPCRRRVFLRGYFPKGSRLNIKITNQDDLDLFEAFCIMQETQGRGKQKTRGNAMLPPWFFDAHHSSVYLARSPPIRGRRL